MDRVHVENLLHILRNGTRLLSARSMRFLSGNDGADIFFCIALFQRIQPQIFLPLFAECEMLAHLDGIAGLIEQFKKGIECVRVFG